MQSGWRLYAVMIGLAALTGTIVALALSGGPRLPSESPRRETATAATATPTASPTRSASTQASPTPTASVSSTPTASVSPTPLAIPSGADPLTRIRPLIFAWKPADTTAIAAKQTANGTRLVAVALDGSTVTPL